MADVKVETPTTNELDISGLVESFDLVMGKQKKDPSKSWTGIRVKMQGDLTFYVFPFPRQLEKIREQLK